MGSRSRIGSRPRCFSCIAELATETIAWSAEPRYCRTCAKYVHYHAEPPDSRVVYGVRLVGEAAERAPFDAAPGVGHGSSSMAFARGREKRVERQFRAFLRHHIANAPTVHGALRIARPLTCVGPDERQTEPDLCLESAGKDIAIEVKAVDARGRNENAEMARGIGQAIGYGWSDIPYAEFLDRYAAVVLLVVRFVQTVRTSMRAIEKLAVQGDTDGRIFVFYYLRRDVVIQDSR